MSFSPFRLRPRLFWARGGGGFGCGVLWLATVFVLVQGPTHAMCLSTIVVAEPNIGSGAQSDITILVPRVGPACRKDCLLFLALRLQNTQFSVLHIFMSGLFHNTLLDYCRALWKFLKGKANIVTCAKSDKEYGSDYDPAWWKYGNNLQD
ncbi:uncharacterized protein B0I36DRAFT_338919 [Microdochium trichocladiopsis]|uniref:Uncharacterized protein n=1 Tax=Microdochium trichocladiopsis TaxID=1682393 RepID=A0A9P9BJF3_9PEZI|nr:uncharacterized protein B0I36DRAFT_338919 [Microdochium trichocladiopsis]KAH7014581.1 hypothetical protein B0I36DRAFT_338919 [Microdochium trichocladiopsis]